MRAEPRILVLTLMIGLCTMPALLAQPSEADRCSDPGYRQFDFWIGTWLIDQTILSPDGSSETFAATTDVRPAVDGCALVEQWRGVVRFPWEGMTAADSLHGLSVRSYEPATGQWNIYWMDSRQPDFGPPFVGRFDDDVGTFTRRTERPDASPVLSRVVFDEIEPKSVRWRLSVSLDEGRTWMLLWQMTMRRRDGPRSPLP